jgi:hypothetical protein
VVKGGQSVAAGRQLPPAQFALPSFEWKAAIAFISVVADGEKKRRN